MSYLSSLDSLADEMNADITEWEGFDRLDGCVYKSEKYHIGIKKSLDLRKKRAILSHELGHVYDETVGIVGCNLAENRADTIALDFLMPTDKLCEALEEFGPDCDFLHQLFGVDIETLQRKVGKSSL